MYYKKLQLIGCIRLLIIMKTSNQVLTDIYTFALTLGDSSWPLKIWPKILTSCYCTIQEYLVT